MDKTGRPLSGTAPVLFVALSILLGKVGAADQSDAAAPPLKMDVAAAMHAAETRAPGADVVQLGPVIVHGKRRLSDALPCIGCDGRQLVPMKRLQDFSEIVESLLIAHPTARPETPEDRALSLAHEQGCYDGGFGCLLPK